MKRIKKRFLYFLGAFIAYSFSCINAVFAAQDYLSVDDRPSAVYGTSSHPFETNSFLGKVLYIIFSPVFLATIFIFAIILGYSAYEKKKKKTLQANAEEKSDEK